MLIHNVPQGCPEGAGEGPGRGRIELAMAQNDNIYFPGASHSLSMFWMGFAHCADFPGLPGRCGWG